MKCALPQEVQPTITEANEFLFAAAKMIHPAVRDRFWDSVQPARTEGNPRKISEAVLSFLCDEYAS